MLETTLLKGTHIKSAPAKLCLPHIKRCDVFGTEHCDGGAAEDEDVWEEILGSPLEKFEVFSHFVHKNLHPLERAFGERLMKYVYQERRPKWFIERYAEEESCELARLFKESNKIGRIAAQQLHQGKLEEAFKLFEQHYLSRNAYLVRRDTNMARQLELAEESIRKRYPVLREKEPLQYTLFVGSNHSPELYTSFPLHVVNIDGEEHIDSYICKNIAKGFGSELRRLTLASEVYNLRLRGTMLIPENELRNKRLDELLELFHKHYDSLDEESPKKSMLANRNSPPITP